MKVTAKMFRLDPYGAELKGQMYKWKEAALCLLTCRRGHSPALLQVDATFRGVVSIRLLPLFGHKCLADGQKIDK